MLIQLEFRVISGMFVYWGYDYYWSVICDFGKGGWLFIFQEIDFRCNDCDGKCISDYVLRLFWVGFLEIVDVCDNVVICYVFINRSIRIENVYCLLKCLVVMFVLNCDGLLGRLGQGQVQFWIVIWFLVVFDVQELVIVVSIEDVFVWVKFV